METLDIPYNIRGNKEEAILDAMREIESLREDLKKATERCSNWADIAGEHGEEKDELRQQLLDQDKAFGLLIKQQRKMGDEWKRRARKIIDWMALQHHINDMATEANDRDWLNIKATFLEDHPEAASWFEEE